MTQQDLLTRYGLFDARVPRYTSYPPANHFSPVAGEAGQTGWLRAVPADEEISVYVHIPFCKRLCWFCACRTQGTQSLRPVSDYIGVLIREIEAVRGHLPRGIRMRALHLGGGTPTILPEADMARLLDALYGAFARADEFEFSVETDPTEASDGLLRLLVRYGLTRASIGVQDFAPRVQEAIGRPQSPEETRHVVELLREAGLPSLNFDLLYGLPFQTADSLGDTLDEVIALRPDRIALYGYAHVPNMSKRQVLIKEETLPDTHTRFALSEQARARLCAVGYRPIGIDHFGLPNDSMTLAAEAGQLRRNFQGYTEDSARTLIGLGASAISRFAEGYSQNAAATPAYVERIEAGGLAGLRGFALGPRECLVADMIEALMCDFAVDGARIAARHPGCEAEISRALAALAEDFPGAGELRDGRFSLAPEAHPLARIVASRLDEFLHARPAQSTAI